MLHDKLKEYLSPTYLVFSNSNGVIELVEPQNETKPDAIKKVEITNLPNKEIFAISMDQLQHNIWYQKNNTKRVIPSICEQSNGYNFKMLNALNHNRMDYCVVSGNRVFFMELGDHEKYDLSLKILGSVTIWKYLMYSLHSIFGEKIPDYQYCYCYVSKNIQKFCTRDMTRLQALSSVYPKVSFLEIKRLEVKNESLFRCITGGHYALDFNQFTSHVGGVST
jgi:hypothetical protein